MSAGGAALGQLEKLLVQVQNGANPQSTRISRSGVIATAGAYQELAGALNNRQALVVQNPTSATESLLVYEGDPLLANDADAFEVKPGERLTIERVSPGQYAIKAATANHAFKCSDYDALHTGSGPALPFVDTMQRANTAAGSLGVASDGYGYDMRGPYVASYPLPAATTGFISSKALTAATTANVNNTVYASRKFATSPLIMGATFFWSNIGGTSANSTLCMASTNSANLIDTIAPHVTVNRGSISVQKRIAGESFVTVATQALSGLAKDGATQYRLEVTHSGTSVLALMTQVSTGAVIADITGVDSDFETYAGPYAFWEIQNNAGAGGMTDALSVTSIYAS